MSNPAIVLLTDPAQCGLGDVHNLVEALREIQQMGEYATPQAFCDHPAAAREFMTAYADAYPKLVLESQAIPTPDHLQSLITNGQIGPLARPQDMASLDEAWRPSEQNGLNTFPLVVLTLGQPQALLDVLEQNQLIKQGISLIDIAPEGASDSMSIAEAVATRGRPVEGLWEDSGASGGRIELDEVERAATPEASDPMLRDDQISLATVEPVSPPSVAPPIYYGEIERQADQAPPSSPAAQPQPAGQAEQSPRPPDSPETQPTAELTEAPVPAPVNAGWPASSTPAPQETVPTEVASDGAVSDGTVPDDADDDATDDGDEAPDDDEEAKAPSDDDTVQEVEDDDEAPLAAGHAPSTRDDDVHYAPVGTLIDGDDVQYPAVDDHDAPATLWELAAAISDEGILDTDVAADMLSFSDEDGAPASTALHPVAPHGSRHEPDTVEELYDSADLESDDAGSDADLSRPMHDSDL